MRVASAATAQVRPGKTIIDSRSISRRLDEMAEDIDRDFAGREVCVVGILHGALPFVCDLVRRLQAPLSLDFVCLSGFRRHRPEQVRLIHDLQGSVEGKHVLILDDLVDTGLSLHTVRRRILSGRPASVTTGTLLARPELHLIDFPVRYVGFRVGKDFLVGYGLDYGGRFRELPSIARLEDRNRPLTRGILDLASSEAASDEPASGKVALCG